MDERDRADIGFSDRAERVLVQLAQTERGLTIEEATAKASSSLEAPQHRVARELYRLWQGNKLAFMDPSPPTKIPQYLRSHYAAWLWGVLAAIAITEATIYLLPQAPPFTYLRYALGSLFVLFLPGYALIEALYPKKEDLEGLERLALSIGLSLALVPLVGLVLNYTPWGIRLDPIFVSLALLTSALAFLAVIRKVDYVKLSSYKAEQQ